MYTPGLSDGAVLSNCILRGESFVCGDSAALYTALLISISSVDRPPDYTDAVRPRLCVMSVHNVVFLNATTLYLFNKALPSGMWGLESNRNGLPH